MHGSSGDGMGRNYQLTLCARYTTPLTDQAVMQATTLSQQGRYPVLVDYLPKGESIASTWVRVGRAYAIYSVFRLPHYAPYVCIGGEATKF